MQASLLVAEIPQALSALNGQLRLALRAHATRPRAELHGKCLSHAVVIGNETDFLGVRQEEIWVLT